jgi:TonB family protein
LILWLAASCVAQSVCPKHIETPIYPPIARAARIEGTVTLKVTIDGDGKVYSAEVVVNPAQQVPDVLARSAFENMMRWTFEKPAASPLTQLIVYQYKFDPSLPANDNNPITEVHIDIPGRVTVLANDLVAQPVRSKTKKQKPSAP